MPPTKDIDMFWHAHILDTYQYEADCDRIYRVPLTRFVPRPATA
jgi:hypothetical protein